MQIIINGLATEYKDEGKGPVVLLLHGWQDSLKTYDFLVPSLLNKHRVVRLDLPGFGKTETPNKNWNLNSYVEFLKSFIKKIDINPEIIIGHSFGGRIILKGESNNQFEAEKIVLINSAGLSEANGLKNKVIGFFTKIGKFLTFLPPLIFWKDDIKNKLYKKLGSDYLESGEMKNVFLNVIKEELSSNATKINKPTLLIWGEEDTATPLSDGKKLNKLIENSKLEIIEGASHFVHIEKPKEVIKLINDFIN